MSVKSLTFTLPDAARKLGMSQSRLYTLVREGKITAARDGRRWRFTLQDIDSYLKGLGSKGIYRGSA